MTVPALWWERPRRLLVRRWRSLNPLTRDAVGGGGLLAVSLVPGMSGSGADLPEFADLPMDATGWALLVALCVPLTLRRRWPAVCAVLTAVAFGLYQVLGYPNSAATLGFPFALYALGAHQVRGRRVLPLVLTFGYVALAVLLWRMGSGQSLLQYVEFYGVLAGFWIVGGWMRTQRAAAEAHRRDSMALAVVAERAVIARELHDVVTHHVTAMVLQADAAGLVLATDPALAAQGTKAVSDTGRQALAELRHLLRVLGTEERPAAQRHRAVEPKGAGQGLAGPRAAEAKVAAEQWAAEAKVAQAKVADERAAEEWAAEQWAVVDQGTADTSPTIDRITDLVERTRTLGQPVEWHEEGVARPTGGGVDLTLYRVVQESLTNAVKHAHGMPTHVRLTHSEHAVAVEIRTDGSATGPSGRAGRGLAGLRERVSVFGGDFEAGPTPAGGFVIRATVPFGAAR
ncbi:hypothetical protein Val02_05750 [Virgisporangium aliadipatigenens]|uniref:histidine kinase n=1 Tax=Virgisporangium aliadipatigenens TaxID=741659 RepID=A0A8J4DMS7_9ACTN|nr:sensor histidine kinase [Virgisporangium aliadipatigenens]GIJ43689.1 hypothetical protein Val02_05750 [Virgisporangium aliadipatigenens]